MASSVACRRFAALRESNLRLLAFGDVEMCAGHAQGFAVRVARGDASAVEHPDPVTCLVAHPHLGLVEFGLTP